MNHALNCKFCSKQILVQIDDAYAALGDPLKILHFASCNNCADLRERKRDLEERIKRHCIGLLQLGERVKPEHRAKAKIVLTALTQKYADLIAQWHNMSGRAWDEEFVELLLDKPGQWPKVLTGYWKHFRRVFQQAQAA